MDEKQLQALYEAMGKKLGLGDYKSFKSQLVADDKFRKAFYDEASTELELGDYNSFDTNVKKKGIGGTGTPSTSNVPSVSQKTGNKTPSIEDFKGNYQKGIVNTSMRKVPDWKHAATPNLQQQEQPKAKSTITSPYNLPDKVVYTPDILDEQEKKLYNQINPNPALSNPDAVKQTLELSKDPVVQRKMGVDYITNLAKQDGLQNVPDIAEYYKGKREQMQAEAQDAMKEVNDYLHSLDNRDIELGTNLNAAIENRPDLKAKVERVDYLNKKLGELNKYANVFAEKQSVDKYGTDYLKVGRELRKINDYSGVAKKEQNIASGRELERSKELRDSEDYNDEQSGIHAVISETLNKVNSKEISEDEARVILDDAKQKNKLLEQKYPEQALDNVRQFLGTYIEDTRNKKDNGVASTWHHVVYAEPSKDEIKEAIKTARANDIDITPEQEKAIIDSKGKIPLTSMAGHAYNSSIVSMYKAANNWLRSNESAEKINFERGQEFRDPSQLQQTQASTIAEPVTIEEGTLTTNPTKVIRQVPNLNAGKKADLFSWTTANNVADAAGTIATYMGLNKGFGTVAEGALGGLATAQRVNIASNVLSSVYLNYHNALDKAKDLTDNKTAQNAFALSSSVITGLVFAGINPNKIIAGASEATEKNAAEKFLELYKEGKGSLDIPKLKEFLADYATNAAKDLGHNISLIKANQLADVALERITNKDALKGRDVMNEVFGNLPSDIISFLPFSLIAGYKKTKSTYGVENAVRMAIADPVNFERGMQKNVEEGKISQEDATKKVEYINSLIKKSNSNDVNSERISKLPQDQQLEYARKLVTEEHLSNKAKGLTDKVQIEEHNKDIERMQNQRKVMLLKNELGDKDFKDLTDEEKERIEPSKNYYTVKTQPVKDEESDNHVPVLVNSKGEHEIVKKSFKTADEAKVYGEEVVKKRYFNQVIKGESVGEKKFEIADMPDTMIKPTFDKAKGLMSEEQISIAQPIIDRVNNADNINENELNKAQDVLYEALEENPDAAHLIEPLILKLQDYEFTTKTEISKTTEERAINVPRKTIERTPVSKSIGQWEGNRATITDREGKETTGVIKIENGRYYLYGESGEKVATIGEKAISDRDISLPSKEEVPNPIEFDKDGNIKSITLQLNKVDTEKGGTNPDKKITVEFRDKEKALDYAIQLRAEQIGEIPQKEFDTLYYQVEKEIKKEVPLNKELDRAKELVNSGIIKGYSIEPLKQAANNDIVEFKQYLKDIAEQAQDTNSLSGTVKTYGQELVDIANKLYPKEQPKVNEEAQAPEVLNPKEEGGTTNEGVDTNIQEAEGEPSKGGITHEATSETRKQLGLEEYEKPETVENKKLLEDARKTIAENPNVANEVMAKYHEGGEMTREDNAILAEYKAALDYKMEKNPTKETFDRINDLIKVLDLLGSKQGALLQSRKLIAAQQDNLANFLIDKQTAQGSKLTEKQIKDESAKYVELKKAKEEVDKALAEEREKNAKLIAEKGFNKAKAERKKENKKTDEEHKATRQEILAKAREALKDLRTGKKGTFATVPFVNDLVAIAPHVKDYMKDLIEQGVSKLDDAVNAIHAEFKDIVEGIKKSDIVDIIAGAYNEKKEPTKNEKMATLRLLERESRLINEIANERKKVEKEKSEQKVKATNKRIEELETKLGELKKLNKSEVKKTEGEKEAAYKKRLLDKIAKLQDDLKNKRFSEEKPKEPELQLTKKTRQLLDRYIDLENKISHERQKDEYEKKPDWIKRYDKVMRVLGIRRLIQSAFDASVAFRQGATLLSTNKADIWAKSFAKMLNVAFNQKNYDLVMHNIRTAPNYHDMIKDGIVFNDLKAADPTMHNEDFQKSFAYDIPGLKQGLLASNRIADGFLNVARYELYNRFSKNLQEQGITRQSDPKEYQDAAKWAMNMTGRGNLLKSLEHSDAQRILGNTFYGARLMASRFNMLSPLTYVKLSPEMRRQAIADITTWASTTMAVGYALSKMGANISLNSDDSDFLQMRFGDKVYDISGGTANYIRTYKRITDAIFDRAFSSRYKGVEAASNAAKSAGSFLRYKLSPNTSYAVSAFLGNSGIDKFKWYDVIKFYPMYSEDVIDAIKKDGLISLATVLAPNIIGVGFNSYGKKGEIDSDLDVLKQRNMTAEDMNPENIKNYKEGGRTVTDNEFDKYTDEWNGKVEKALEKLFNSKSIPVIRDGQLIKVEYKDLTKEELASEIKRIKSEITRETKEALFGVKVKSRAERKAEEQLSKERKKEND